jgi:hypothetical protein
LAKVHKISLEDAFKRMEKLVVSHPKTANIDSQVTEDLFLTSRPISYKLRIINAVSTSLGLGYGKLVEYIKEDELSRLTAEQLLETILDRTGILQCAQTRVAAAEATKNQK